MAKRKGRPRNDESSSKATFLLCHCDNICKCLVGSLNELTKIIGNATNFSNIPPMEDKDSIIFQKFGNAQNLEEG